MSIEHVHEALQLTAVAMLYALGLVTLIRGWHVLRGDILAPSAMLLMVLGVYLMTKAVKHTWFTAAMLRAAHGDQTAFRTHLWLPTALDFVLIALASIVVFLSARQSLGRLAGPIVAVAIIALLGLGAAITHG